MKIAVRYYGIIERTVEVDDKFNRLRGYNFNSTNETDVLIDELIEDVLQKVPVSIDELYNISTADTKEILTEF